VRRSFAIHQSYLSGARNILRLRLLSLFLLLSVQGRSAFSYPDFISHGYTSCLTCHYNGNGGGPVNDYGRALWATEFSSRLLFPQGMSEDDLIAQSGFLGTAPMPSWFRAQIDYRDLQLHTNPGSASTDASKYYQMQADLSLILQNESNRVTGVVTYGRQVPPEDFGLGTAGLNHLLAKEYYLRVETIKGWFVYAGLLEKVFGIRNVNHMSYQRVNQGFNIQNNSPDGTSTSQGVVVQGVGKAWELNLNGFIGNPYDSQQSKQSGGSLMSEIDVGEYKRLGVSLFSGTSAIKNKQMAAIHYRQQVGIGSALLAEYGLIQDTLASSSVQVGSYNYLEVMAQLTRGYNLLTTVERYNTEFKPISPDQWRFGIGFLIFPIQRFEFRAEAINERQFSAEGVQNDAWVLEGQLHVSL